MLSQIASGKSQTLWTGAAETAVRERHLPGMRGHKDTADTEKKPPESRGDTQKAKRARLHLQGESWWETKVYKAFVWICEVFVLRQEGKEKAGRLGSLSPLPPSHGPSSYLSAYQEVCLVVLVSQKNSPAPQWLQNGASFVRLHPEVSREPRVPTQPGTLQPSGLGNICVATATRIQGSALAAT